MSWRTALGVALLVFAVLSGWALLRDRDAAPKANVDDGSVDYVLHDFQIVALDDQGKESTTLRAPLMERTRADQIITIATPVFEMPDDQGQHWTLRADTGRLTPKGDQMRPAERRDKTLVSGDLAAIDRLATCQETHAASPRIWREDGGVLAGKGRGAPCARRATRSTLRAASLESPRHVEGPERRRPDCPGSHGRHRPGA